MKKKIKILDNNFIISNIGFKILNNNLKKKTIIVEEVLIHRSFGPTCEVTTKLIKGMVPQIYIFL